MDRHPAHALATANGGTWEWLPVFAAFLPLAAYTVATLHQSRRGRPWPAWRAAAWSTGLVVAAIAFAPPVSLAAHEDLRAHVAQHLILGMFAPLALIMGTPVTLALRSLPTERARRVAALLRSRPVHLLSHPATALVLNIGTMYALYLTPLFSWTMSDPALHALMNIHFLLAGYLFAWSIAGSDPAPRRPGFLFRLAMLGFSIGLHAFLGKIMYARLLPTGTPFNADEIQDAAVLMYYGGDIAELLLVVTLFASWYAHRRRRYARLMEGGFGPAARGQRKPVASG